MSATETIGGPMPHVGANLCAGWQERPAGSTGAFRVGTVVAVGEVTNGEARWAAIVQPTRGRLEIVTDVDMHVGTWRTMVRANERADEHATQQLAQRAAWHTSTCH